MIIFGLFGQVSIVKTLQITSVPTGMWVGEILNPHQAPRT